MHSIRNVTQPSVEPVSVATLQAYLRVNTATENSLLAGFITAARTLFERETNLCLITQILNQYLETPPPYTTYLMRGQIQSVNSVTYYDSSNNLQTASGYNTDIVTGGMGRLWFPNGQPSMSCQVSPVMTINFTCGFGNNASDVPQPISQAIMLLSAYYFENRTAYTDMTLKNSPAGFEGIVDQYRLGNYYDFGMNRNRIDNRVGNPAFPWSVSSGVWGGW